MSFTRKRLAAIGIEAEKIDEVINMYLEEINPLKEERDALKDERDKLKEKADKADALQQELDGIKDDGYKEKYEKLDKDFKDFKKQTELKETRSAKEKAFTEVLKDIGITDEKHIAKVLKYSDIDAMELDDDGKLVDAKTIAKETKTEWAEFVTTVGTKGHDTPDPDSKNSGGKTMTKEQIMEIKDTAERQKAMRENPELFGINV